MTPIEFLTARYDEREAIVPQLRGAFVKIEGDWIPYSSPEQCRRDLALKRKILGDHSWPSTPRSFCPGEDDGYPIGKCPTIRALLTEFNDHPDFDPEWAI